MQNYNCKHCGAVLYFDAELGCLECKYCGSRFQAEEFGDDTTRLSEEVKNEAVDAEFASEEIEDGKVLYSCSNCGGSVVADEITMATVCPYCGEAISITSKSVGMYRPEVIIPFSQTKQEIEQIYKNYVKKSFLAPKTFKEESTVEKIQGLYTPFYLHTMDNLAACTYTGEKTISHRRGDYIITDHEVYELTVRADGHFENIPTDGSVRVDNALMEAIEPFDYRKLTDYNPAYMAGFLAEQIDEKKEDMIEAGIARCEVGMRTKMQNEFKGYSSFKVKDESFDIENHNTRYAMLPVWLLTVNYNSKKYKFAINGQTGKVTGKLPLSWGKLLGVCGVAFAVVDVFVAALMNAGII